MRIREPAQHQGGTGTTDPRHFRHGLPSLLMVLVLAAACSPETGSGSGTREIAVPDPPAIERVVLVTIDTLRADHMGSYGYLLDTTPFLDSLAETGVRFSRAYSQTGTTGPSHSSLFTGLYPVQHNVLWNNHSLASEFLTLAEVLSAAGVTTAATTSTDAHFEWGGLTQGFEHYDGFDRAEAGEIEAPDLYRQADRTIDAAIEWLDTQDAAQSFLLWVHLFDPHRPLRPPAEHMFAMRRRQDVEPEELERFLLEEHRLQTDGKLLETIYKYDAEIAFDDAQLERLFDELEARGMQDGTLWVITADHGQGLFTHDWFGHTMEIYNTQLHVPLIMWMKEGLPKGLVIAAVVEHVDVTPTIAEMTRNADLLSAQPAEIQGVSLWGLIAGVPATYGKQFAFGQRAVARSVVEASRVVSGPSYALQDDRYKLVYRPEVDGADEFYDLQVDPYEQRNIIVQQAELAGLFRDRLVSLVDRLNNPDAPIEVDPVAIERLRALGYIQ